MATAASAPPEIDHGPGHPWLSCVVPMVTFLAIGALEPGQAGGGIAGMMGITGDRYPVVYGIRVAATLLLLAWAWPGLRGWLGRPTWWPPLVGLALVVPWVILARLQHDAGWLLGGTERVASIRFSGMAQTRRWPGCTSPSAASGSCCSCRSSRSFSCVGS